MLHFFLAIVPDRTIYIFSSELSPLGSKDDFLKTSKIFSTTEEITIGLSSKIKAFLANNY